MRACVTSHDDDVLKLCSQRELLTNRVDARAGNSQSDSGEYGFVIRRPD